MALFAMPHWPDFMQSASIRARFFISDQMQMTIESGYLK
jgi:hypothetical protein